MESGTWQAIQIVGALFLFGGSSVLGYHLAMRLPKSCDYLIDMDVELRKVVWPAVQPLFDPKTEAWGSTYVVILCTIVLGLFIWIVDKVLQFSITDGFLHWLYS